jgi:GTP-binding protein
MIDVSEFSERDPVHDYHVIMGELKGFSAELAKKQMVVAATKIDSAQDPGRIAALETFCHEQHLPFFAISAVTGEGVDKLKYYLGAQVRESQLVPETT